MVRVRPARAPCARSTPHTMDIVLRVGVGSQPGLPVVRITTKVVARVAGTVTIIERVRIRVRGRVRVTGTVTVVDAVMGTLTLWSVL